jgi:SAM-dependent methyltransferase
VAGVDHESDAHARRASSFGTQAAAYAEYRPDYPAALVDFGLSDLRASVHDQAEPRVLDLAAGTGKLTGGLVAQGVDVVAVEPDPAMRAQLTSRFPDVRALFGTAEAIPLPDDSVHAVFVGQALYWFDLDRALPEIGRVLRPGGSLVAAWNADDDRVPWVAELSRLSGAPAWNGELDPPHPRFERFGVVEQRMFPYQSAQTVDHLVNTVATYSWILVSTPERRAAILERVRRFLLTNPVTAGGEFAMPMVGIGMKVTPRTR